MFGASTVQGPHLLLGCQTDVQNSLGFRHWYRVKSGSTSVSDAFRHPPNQPLRHIKFSNSAISHIMAFSHALKASHR